MCCSLTLVHTDGSRYWFFCFKIDGFQSCLAYCIQVRMSNRLYDYIMVLKCIFVMFCVILYDKIYIRKLLVLTEVCNLLPCNSFYLLVHETTAFSIL